MQLSKATEMINEGGSKLKKSLKACITDFGWLPTAPKSWLKPINNDKQVKVKIMVRFADLKAIEQKRHQ